MGPHIFQDKVSWGSLALQPVPPPSGTDPVNASPPRPADCSVLGDCPSAREQLHLGLANAPASFPQQTKAGNIALIERDNCIYGEKMTARHSKVLFPLFPKMLSCACKISTSSKYKKSSDEAVHTFTSSARALSPVSHYLCMFHHPMHMCAGSSILRRPCHLRLLPGSIPSAQSLHGLWGMSPP